MYHGYRGVVDVLACPQATFNANLWVFKYYISQINGMCRNYCCCYTTILLLGDVVIFAFHTYGRVHPLLAPHLLPLLYFLAW